MLTHYRPNKKAFTLIELLVVISIIALLISMLLPALGAAREAAMVSKNLSNLRQIQISLFAYTNDYKGHLPYNRNNISTNNNTGPFWPGVIVHGGYVSDPFIFWGPMRPPTWMGTGTYTSRENTYTTPLTSNAYDRTDFGANIYIMPNHYSNALVEQKSYRLGDNVPTSTVNAPPNGNHPSIVPLLSQFYFNTHAGTADAYMFGKHSGPGGGEIFSPRGNTVRTYLDGHAANRSPLDLGWNPSSPVSGNWIYASVVCTRFYWFYPL